MAPINPRPGVVVALTDRLGDIAVYDPDAWWRKERKRYEERNNTENRVKEGGSWPSRNPFSLNAKSF